MSTEPAATPGEPGKRSSVVEKLIAGALAGESRAPRGVGAVSYEQKNAIRLLLYDGEGPPRWVTLPESILPEILRTLAIEIDVIEQIKEPERRLWRAAQAGRLTHLPDTHRSFPLHFFLDLLVEGAPLFRARSRRCSSTCCKARFKKSISIAC